MVLRVDGIDLTTAECDKRGKHYAATLRSGEGGPLEKGQREGGKPKTSRALSPRSIFDDAGV